MRAIPQLVSAPLNPICLLHTRCKGHGVSCRKVKGSVPRKSKYWVSSSGNYFIFNIVLVVLLPVRSLPWLLDVS